MVSNGVELTSNLQSLLNVHSKAIDVINAAKKKSNKDISSIVGIAETTTSTILNVAKKFNYVSKEKNLWSKTKEIKGLNLYRMANVKFKSEISKPKKIKGVKNSNPFSPLSYYADARNMADCYVPLFCLENTIRDFLRKIFKKESNWIKKRVGPDILSSIERAKKEPYYAHKIRRDDLEYATLGHLLEIIVSNKNWKDILPKLKEKDKKAFISTFQKVLPSRNSTGHCVVLNKGDRELVTSRVKEVVLMFDFS